MVRTLIVASAASLALALPAYAQSQGNNEFPTQTSIQLNGGSNSDFQDSESEARLSGEQAVRARTTQQATVELSGGDPLPVFGTDLFNGAFASARPAPPSSYQIQPGDKLSVRIYGAINSDAVQTVDSTGRVFVQGVGPVAVGGVQASQVQTRIRAALSQVFTDAVSVYVDVLQGGTLGIFVTGDVSQPGRYVGSPGDSILYFLDQAGGIDVERGSFRNIQILRGGQSIADYDLYPFLLSGRLESFRFEDGDTILVGPRGALVGVTGDAVLNDYVFELPPGATQISGRDLLALARPTVAATGGLVLSTRQGSGRSVAVDLNQFATLQLGDGDQANIVSDIYVEQIGVTVEGDIRAPSIYALPRGAMLSQLLAQLPLDGSNVATEYVHIERNSVAQQQKAALNEALNNLERAILTTPVLSSESAALRAAESSSIARFIERARAVEPEGKVAVYTDGRFNDVRLENGDRIVLPKRSDIVIVAGEVLSPGAFVGASRLRVRDYVLRAGGFAPNANKRRFILRRPDGSALVVDGGERPRPGDQIVVTPGLGNRNLQLLKDITQIAFQIATSAAAVINISDRN
jgi:protein involved in polysaccharide export with SLBB domain